MIKRGFVTLQKVANRVRFCPAFEPNVKNVPKGRLQGLDPGEIVLGDFPLRLWKSRK